MRDAARAAAIEPTDSWTTRKLLEWTTRFFRAKGLESPRVCAELLLAHVLGCERLRLYMEADRPASAGELERYRDLVRKAGDRSPIEYLTGTALFLGRTFEVDRSTLIPRPSTETLVESVLEHWQRRNESAERPEVPLMADIGTGTGCIAISVALGVPGARLVATDVEPQALDLAARNARRHGVEGRIDFRLGSMLEPLGDACGPLDAILSNPPYVPDDEWQDPARIGANVRGHEPERALRGGADGLDLIRPLLSGAVGLLKPGGRLWVEIAHRRRDEVAALIDATAGLELVEILKDHEGLWRVATAVRVPTQADQSKNEPVTGTGSRGVEVRHGRSCRRA